jgi:hypothetical protein
VSRHAHSDAACIGLNPKLARTRFRPRSQRVMSSHHIILQALCALCLVCAASHYPHLPAVTLVDIPFGWDVEHGNEYVWNADRGMLGGPVLYPVMLFSLTVTVLREVTSMYVFFPCNLTVI